MRCQFCRQHNAVAFRTKEPNCFAFPNHCQNLHMQPLPLMLNHILVKMRKITLKNLNPNSKTITSLKKIISDQHDLQRSPVTTKVFKLGNENLEPSSLEKLQDAKPKQTGGSQQLLSLLQLHLQVDRNVPSITATRLQDIHLLRVVLTIV